MRAILKTILVSLSVMCLISCKKDLLDKKPLDIVSDEAVWSDIYLSEAFLNNIYNSMYDGYSRRESSWCYGCYMLDAGSDDGKTSTNWTESEKLNFNNFTPNDAPLRFTWQDMYAAIRKTNLFLSKIDAVPNGDPKDKDRMKGEAQFLRAFFYFELMRQYGGVPIITKLQELNEELLVPRESYAKVAEFVTNELKEAAQALPLNPSQVGRATKGAAMALKGRVFLYWASPLNNTANDLSLWQKAAQASLDVIQLGKYALFPDYGSLFQPSNENNVEVIFDKQFRYPVNANPHNTYHTPYSQGGFISGWGGTNATQELVDAYEMTDGKSITESPLYMEQNPYVNRDPRFYKTVLFEGAKFLQAGKEYTIETRVGGDNGLGSNAKDATKTGYYIGKFLDWNGIPSYATSGLGLSTEQNWIYIRYAEVLLNYAEAQNEAVGPDNSVYEAINQVRQRSSMPPLPPGLSKEQMRQRIRNERRIELAFEEHRFWDIRRWKIGEQVLKKAVHGIQITIENGQKKFKRIEVETRNFEQKHYYFPILETEVSKSGGKIEQTPGW